MKTRICTIIAFISAFLIWSDNIQAQSPGNALDFDGSNDYVSVPDAAALDITDQITIEGWFKPSASSWAYKKLVTIDYTKVLANQTDFPVLVSVTDTDLLDTDNSGLVQPDGDDILFTGTDGAKLSHEIEEYDGSTGKLIAWVKVPSLSSVTDTEIYLYYGNSGCSSQQDAANVWTSNFEGVWHMDDNQYGTNIFEDGFEDADWDAKWDDNGTTTWDIEGAKKYEGGYSAVAYGSWDGDFTSDDIDVSGASFINIDFWLMKKNLEAGEITIYFYDGTGYDLIADLDTVGADNEWLHVNFRVTDSQYLISNFRIRFSADMAGSDAVWIDAVKIVEDGPGITDSSPNGNTGGKRGSAEITGQIFNAQDFDEIDDFIDIADVENDVDVTKGTVSAWITLDPSSADNVVVDLIADGENRLIMYWDDTNEEFELWYNAGGTYDGVQTSLISEDSQWHLATMTWNTVADEFKVYVDGSQIGTTQTGLGTWAGSFNGNGAIGADAWAAHGYTWDGIIDEVRISSSARDSSWIATEYNNMNSPGTFMSFGSETYVGVAGKSTAYGIGTDNSVAYATINDQTLSGSITASQWNHIALSYNKDAGGTDEMKLYINGTQSATGDYATAITTNNDALILGNLVGFLGKMDEVRLWNDVRTESEIRDNMHRVVDPASANLVAYWQYNESSGTSAADSAGTNTGTLTNMTDADWVSSTAPFGGGLVNDTTSFTSGTTNLGTFSLTTTDAFDAAVKVVATEILNGPNVLPASPDSLDDRYWVVNVYGSPGTFSVNVTFQLPSGYLNPGEEAGMKLWKRGSNSDGSWNLEVDGAASMTDTTVTFNGISSFSQFTITGNSGFPMPVELTSFTADFDGTDVKLMWETATEINNYGFEVHRSIKTDRWETIGFVEGHGNTYSPKKYEFTDDLSGLADPSQVDSLNYRLKQIDLDGKYEFYELAGVVNLVITGINDAGLPEKFELYQNYPNPFNPSSTIKFSLPESGHTLVEVFNSIGQKAATLVNRELPAGFHQVEWNASGFSSGIYVYRLSTARYSETKKMILLR